MFAPRGCSAKWYPWTTVSTARTAVGGVAGCKPVARRNLESVVPLRTNTACCRRGETEQPVLQVQQLVFLSETSYNTCTKQENTPHPSCLEQNWLYTILLYCCNSVARRKVQSVVPLWTAACGRRGETRHLYTRYSMSYGLYLSEISVLVHKTRKHAQPSINILKTKSAIILLYCCTRPFVVARNTLQRQGVSG